MKSILLAKSDSLERSSVAAAGEPAVIHVDLDGAAEISEAHGWQYDAPGDPLFESGLRSALQFFAANRITATLFVISRQLDDPRKRSLLQEAVRQGHEIASHTQTHRSLLRLNRKEKRAEIRHSRERLGAALGVNVEGFRAPGFHIDRESLEFIAEAGYRYDSSLFPTTKFARQTGIRQVRDGLFRPLEGAQLMELSLPNPAPLPFPFHPCFSLVLGMPYFHAGLKRFSSRHCPLVFLFHLTDFADPLPDTHLNGWRNRFYTLSYLSGEKKRERCQRMLNAVRERFRVGTTKELLEGLAA